jgi:hypothetical protein
VFRHTLNVNHPEPDGRGWDAPSRNLCMSIGVPHGAPSGTIR